MTASFQNGAFTIFDIIKRHVTVYSCQKVNIVEEKII